MMDERTRAFKYVHGAAIVSRHRRRPPHLGLLSTTVLLLFICLLGLRLYILSRKLQDLQQPFSNTAVITLDPEGEGQERGPELGHRNLVPTRSSVLLILNYLGRMRYPRYLAHIRERSGREIWSDSDLQQDPASGGFAIYLPQGFLPQIPCSIEIYGVVAKRESHLATYQIEPARSAGP